MLRHCIKTLLDYFKLTYLNFYVTKKTLLILTTNTQWHTKTNRLSNHLVITCLSQRPKPSVECGDSERVRQLDFAHT